MLTSANVLQWLCFTTVVGTMCSMTNVYMVQHAKYTDRKEKSEWVHKMCRDNQINNEVLKCDKAKQDVDSLNPRLMAIIDMLEVPQILGAERCLVVAHALHDALWTIVLLMIVCGCLAAWLWLHVYKTNVAHRNLSALPVDQSLRFIDASSAPMGSIAYKQHWE
jgi:hypothetical protein